MLRTASRSRSLRARRTPLTLAVVALVSCAAVLPALASGQEQDPVLRVIAPGASVANGSTPRFVVSPTKAGRKYLPRRRPSAVFVIVSKSPSRDRYGVLVRPVYLAQMARSGTTFRATPKRRTYPEYWLRKSGTYYWQSYIVRCEPGEKDCFREIAPRKLVVRKP